MSSSTFSIDSPPLSGIAPTYLLELFTLTLASYGEQSLRSASRGDFVVPHARTAIKQHRAFSIVGPTAWNGLPFQLRSLPRDLSSYFTSSSKLLFSPEPGLGAPLE